MSDTASIDEWMGRALNVNIDRSGRSSDVANLGSDDADAPADPAMVLAAAAPTPTASDDAPDGDGSSGAGAATAVAADASNQPGKLTVPDITIVGAADPAAYQAGFADGQQFGQPRNENIQKFQGNRDFDELLQARSS